MTGNGGPVTMEEPAHRGPDLLGPGRAAAIICGIGAVGYGVASILVGSLATSAITWEGLQRFVSDYSPAPTLAIVLPPFVVAVVFPLLILAITTAAPPQGRPFARLALVLAGIYTAVLGTAYWVQLTYVPWNLMRDTTGGLTPWIMWNPASLFWPLETFGYFAMGMACLSAGVSLRHVPGPSGLRRGLLAMGAVGAYFMVVAFKDLLFSMAFGEPWSSGMEALATAMALSALFAWVIVFSFVSFSAARWFSGRIGPMRRSPDAAPREAPFR
jgi:hypothetical protein